MKKTILVCCMITASSMTCVKAESRPLVVTPEMYQKILEEDYPYNKIGPSDPVLYRRYAYERRPTTLGQLANWSDLIAIGRVATQDWASVTINVETALVGCTNGQPVIIKLWPRDDPERFRALYEGEWLKMKDRFPTNNALIVFSAYTNETRTSSYIRPVTWPENQQPDASRMEARPDYRWLYTNRSWWYTGRDNGVLLEQFTNVIHVTRIERNWTNYVHLCRDGNFKDSIRVREDSFYDLREVIKNADANQTNYIFNDPLIMPELKEYLFEKHPHLKTQEQ